MLGDVPGPLTASCVAVPRYLVPDDVRQIISRVETPVVVVDGGSLLEVPVDNFSITHIAVMGISC